MSSAVADIGIAQEKSTDKRKSERPYFDLPRKAWSRPLLYMLSLSLYGLQFYPALLFIAILWVRAYRTDKYDFLIMLSIFFGAFGIIQYNLLPLWTADMGLILASVYWVILRKPPILKKTLIAIAIYFLFLCVFAYLSLEQFSIQLLIMRNYLGIIYLIVPIAIFAGLDFDIDVFFTRLMPYILIMCAFYIFDGIIVPGNILVPCTMIGSNVSTFYDIYHLPFGSMHRKYPPGLFLIALVILPISKYYRLRPWQWALIFGALIVSRTFTVISGIVLGLILFQGSMKKILAFFGLCIASFGMLYGIDCLLPTRGDIHVESTLRIKSSIDQFMALREAVDDEDIAEFASGRMAQILPKVDLIIKQHRTAIGLGFLHPEKSTVNRYVITNEYYTDVSNAEEVATAVEVVPVQVFINIGYIGLIGHTLFFIVLYLFIRRLKYSIYYVSVAFAVSWFGLGGFAGLANFHGLELTALAYGVVILANRDKLKWNRKLRKQRLNLPLSISRT